MLQARADLDSQQASAKLQSHADARKSMPGL